MKLKDVKAGMSASNPELRALLKQIADLIAEARAAEAWLNLLHSAAPGSDFDMLDREIDNRWQTIEELAHRFFGTCPFGLTDAAAQARVALALSNAGAWNEDHSLTAVTRSLAALAPLYDDDPALATAMRKIGGTVNEL